MTIDINFAEFDRIYPTQKDIAFAPYNGVNSTEQNFTNNLNTRYARNYILPNLDGNGVPETDAGFVITDGGGLNSIITRGRSYIQGRYFELLTGPDFTVPLDDDRDTYIYLQLQISGVVNDSPPAQFVTVPVLHDADHTIQINAVLLGAVRTDTGVITSIRDFRPSPHEEYIPDMKFCVRSLNTGLEGFVPFNTSEPTRTLIDDAITNTDVKIWHPFKVPDWENNQFRVGGWVSVGMGDLSGGSDGQVNFTARMYIRNGAQVVSNAFGVTKTIDVFAQEDEQSSILTFYMSIGTGSVITDLFLSNLVKGRQLEYAISFEINSTSGSISPTGDEIVFQTYPFNSDLTKQMDKLSDIDGSRTFITDFFNTVQSDGTWRIKSTKTEF